MVVIKAEVKDTNYYDLQCQVETQDSKETKSSTINLSQAPRTEWPTFKFLIKQSLNAAFRFTVTDLSGVTDESVSEIKPTEIGNCLYPLTFSSPHSKDLAPLAAEMSIRAKQIHVAYLTSKINGSNLRKVIGRVWFKVVNQKPVPKQILKSRVRVRVSWMDLSTVQVHLAKPEKRPGPSIPDLIEKESQLKTTSSFLLDSPTISVIFHAVNSYMRASDMTPIACVGADPTTREKSLFEESEDGNKLNLLSILKPVTLVCEDSEHSIELYLASTNSVIFSSAHPMQMLMPFKQYNWEYTWRWMAGSGELGPLHTSASSQEPSVMTSLIYHPSASQYAKYEGLEFLVYGIELDSSVECENVVLSVQFADLKSMSRSQMAAAAGSGADRIPPFKCSTVNVTTSNSSSNEEVVVETNMSVVKFGDSSSQETTPAYFFYPINPFFQSKGKGVSLALQLYALNNKQEGKPWWEASNIASSVLEISSAMITVLTNPENSNGIYWELTGSDIVQSGPDNVAGKLFGVVRWKKPKMMFLNKEIESQIHNLRAFKEFPVRGVQPGLLASILPEFLGVESVEEESNNEREESVSAYKAAITKMGDDILQLREQNKILKRDNQRLEQHLEQMEMNVLYSVSNQALLQALTKADLIHKIIEQSHRLNTEIQARKNSQDKISALQNSLIVKNDVEGRFMQLQEAHSAQQKLVRDLQLKLEKYRRCADTCKQQEGVIVQLDSLLAQRAQDVRVKDAMTVLSKENAMMRKSLRESKERSVSLHPSHGQEQTVFALKADIAKLRTKCEYLTAQLEESRKNCGNELRKQTKVFEADQKAKIAAARESTLVNELEESARIWAKEKARYEFKIAEYRVKVQTLEERLRVKPNSPEQRSQRNMSLLDSRESEHRHPLALVSRQLHPYSSTHSQEREHTQSLHSDSLDPRLSF